MTTIRKFDQKCFVCGKSSPQPVLGSTCTLGYPDLDLRPSEMKRSSMIAWISECPNCGYVAPELDKKTHISEEFLKRDEYLTCDGIDFKSNLSKLFYRQYLIAKETNDIMACFISLRNCAWNCDDWDSKNSKQIRKLALPYLDKLIPQSDSEERNYLMLIKADFLRRSEEFEQLIKEYENITVDDKIINELIQFEIKKAHEKDTNCYTTEIAYEK